MSTARQLRHLRLKDSFIAPPFRFPSTLEVLTLDHVGFSLPATMSVSLSVSTSVQQDETLPFLSGLRVLEMKGVIHVSSVITMMKGSHSTTLNRLDLIDSCVQLSDLMTLLESGQLSKLIFLGTSQSELNDDHLQRIAVGCPLLEHMELCGLRITGCAVKELCARTALKTLKLSKCLCISSDAITWARARGVKVVVHQMDEQRTSSGRRIRYYD